MIDPVLLTMMLVITLGGIGLVAAVGIAYIIDDAIRRRDAHTPERSPATSTAPAATGAEGQPA
ncbi:hypothetical protein ACFOVU_12960 [Nocardiopsis sediminis]|uniref:Uncharacterized protein n=1 Tax=Nocardiopsis sediminis TaxID=1778267 RepID=A0ABV8FNC9_9ACTN